MHQPLSAWLALAVIDILIIASAAFVGWLSIRRDKLARLDAKRLTLDEELLTLSRRSRIPRGAGTEDDMDVNKLLDITHLLRESILNTTNELQTGIVDFNILDPMTYLDELERLIREEVIA